MPSESLMDSELFGENYFSMHPGECRSFALDCVK